MSTIFPNYYLKAVYVNFLERKKSEIILATMIYLIEIFCFFLCHVGCPEAKVVFELQKHESMVDTESEKQSVHDLSGFGA